MIVGFWSGITLDARAANQEITEIEIELESPTPGQPFPGMDDVSVNTPKEGLKVALIEWYESNIYDPSKIVSENAKAKYSTVYTVWVVLSLEENYKFGSSTETKINGKKTYTGSNNKELRIVHTFPKTETEPVQTISSIEITAPQPEAGQELPYFPEVTYETTEAKGMGINWYEGMDTSGANVAGNEAEYDTVYTMSIRYEAKDGFIFGSNTTATVNGNMAGCEMSGTDVCYVTYTFPATGAEQKQTINSVNITIAPPVAGQPFATTCEVSTQGVSVGGIRWYYTDGRGDASTLAEYNTEYAVNVFLDSATNYKFAPASEITATVNGQNNTQPQDISQRSIYVRYVFPATDPEPSGGDYAIIEGDGNTYVQGSDEPLSFRGDGSFDYFDHIEVDGNMVDEKYYTKKAGSTIITFTPEYLKTLSNGTHTIEMFWNINGAEKSATASFHIGEKSGEVVPGNTGTT